MRSPAKGLHFPGILRSLHVDHNFGRFGVHPEVENPLKTPVTLCETLLSGVNTVHILPFFPSSPDRGFSVIDAGWRAAQQTPLRGI